MNTVAVVAQNLIRLAGVVLLILGVLFWTGNALNLVPVHIWAGFVLVGALWLLAIAAAASGAGLGVVVLALLWGLFVVYFGLTHGQMLPGPAHWIVQVLHLLVGVGTIGIGERIGERVRKARSRGVQA